MIVRFADEVRRLGLEPAPRARPAQFVSALIIVLPVIRIEHYDAADDSPRRKRRRNLKMKKGFSR